MDYKARNTIKKLKGYFLNLILIWGAFLIYKFNDYYREFIMAETKTAILYLTLSYTILALPFYLISPYEKLKDSKGLLVFRAIKKIALGTTRYLANIRSSYKSFPKIEHQEKTAILFIFVKLFFLPLMLNFFFSNLNNVIANKEIITNFFSLFSVESFNYTLFPFLLSLIFMIDTLYFAFGYIFEANFLKNKVRSVEPTIIGWAVALVCYPPFNTAFNSSVGWYANEYITFESETAIFALRSFLLLLLLVYLSASLALGTRCSNLTNRGIATKGPYAIIRHPAYISKNLFWWITIIPIISWPAVLSASVWSFVYYIRAITEERHLIKDPDYQEYCKKVKYRFIPFVY